MSKVYTWDQLFSRRQFIKGTVATAALGATAGMGLLTPESNLGQESLEQTSTKGVKFVTTICEQCVWRCGVVARVEDGIVKMLEGNPNHPNNLGKLCPRGNAGIETLYSPDRLKFPLIRAGARGSGLWRRASWDEALSYTAEQMKKIKDNYGAKAMMFNSTDNLSQPFFEILLKAYGTPNYGTQRSLCFNSMTTGFLYTYGTPQPGTDFSKCKYMIFTGRNLAEGISNSETQEMIEMLAKGVKVVVLDPRFSKTASKATEWLPVRPGTDSAFFLAMIHVAAVIFLATLSPWNRARHKELQVLTKADATLIILECLLMLMMIVMGIFSSESESRAFGSLLYGPYAGIFWLLIVGLGLVLPLLLELMELKDKIPVKWTWPVTISSSFLVIMGGFYVRYIITFAGQTSGWF